MDTIPYVHLGALDVACPECNADTGVDCQLDYAGHPYMFNGAHAARHDAADHHTVEEWRQVPDSDVTVGRCIDCGAEVDR